MLGMLLASQRRDHLVTSCWHYFSPSGSWHPSRLSSFHWTTCSHQCFHILKQFGQSFSEWLSVHSSHSFQLFLSSRIGALWSEFSVLETAKSRRGLRRDCTSVRWMRWRIIVVKKAVTARPKMRLFSSSSPLEFSKSKHKFLDFSSSFTVKRRSLIASRTCSIFSDVIVLESQPERRSLSTDVLPFLNRLYHSICFLQYIHSTSKAFCVIVTVSAHLFSSLMQNLINICWSHSSKSDRRKRSTVNKYMLLTN